jgi:hypothetical protein
MSTRRTVDMTTAANNGPGGAATGGQGALPVANVRDWGCELPAGANWDAAEEEGQQIDVAVDFYQAALPNPMIRRIVTLSDTTSTQLTRNPEPTGLDDLVLRGQVATPGAFTAALAGWRAAGTKAARQRALAEALLAAGVVHSSLGGSTS